MTPEIEMIWWVTLGIALVLTLIATGLVLAVVRMCGQIVALARRTVPAANGIERNVASLAGLTQVLGLAPTLLAVTAQLGAGSETIAATLESVAPKEKR